MSTTPTTEVSSPLSVVSSGEHLINHRIEFVTGAFDMKTGKLIAVQSKKYGDVELCFKAAMNIPFAAIKLYTKDLARDADAVFEDAVRLGTEICRRWNHLSEANPVTPNPADAESAQKQSHLRMSGQNARCIILNTHRLFRSKYRARPLWVLVSDITGNGSGYSIEICKSANLDPDQNCSNANLLACGEERPGCGKV